MSDINRQRSQSSFSTTSPHQRSSTFTPPRTPPPLGSPLFFGTSSAGVFSPPPTSLASAQSRTNPPSIYLAQRTKHTSKSSFHTVGSASSLGQYPTLDKISSSKPIMGGSVAMQWHRSEVSGNSAPPPLRAHTMTLVKDKIFVFGGCDASVCFNTLYIFDPDSLWWAKAKTRGNIPPPCRAHSTNYENNKLWVFGGGDGPYYYNHLYVLDCDTLTWSIPETTGVAPGPRRAHSSWIYDKALWIYAGGDGVQALGDMFKLDLATLAWTKVTGVMGSVPPPRGYHTSTIVNNTVIMYGGSDGHECFSDIYIFHLEELRWNRIQYERPAYSRLSHTATLVGSFLFIIGGHDGTSYSSEVLMLNLITMEWEQRLVVGLESPGERGYHSACYNDSRVFVFGGYNGQEVFNDMFILDLSSVAYLTQTSDFEITMLDDKKIIGI